MKTLQLLFISAVVFVFGFMFVEGTIVSAQAGPEQEAFNVRVAVTKEISFSCAPHATTTDETPIGSIPGMTGGTVTSTAAYACTVITNSQEGYTLTAQATSTPALRKIGDEQYTFANIGAARYDLDLATNESVFGFSASSTFGHNSLTNSFLGAACAGGTESNINHCWNGLTEAPVSVINYDLNTGASGEEIKFGFIAGVGADSFQVSGLYNANVVLTAAVQ